MRAWTRTRAKTRATTWTKATLFPLALLLAAPLGTAAQETHVIDRTELEGVTAEATADEEAKRSAIRSVLQRPEVRQTARAHGIDLTRAEDAAATLEGEELDRAYRQTLDVREALAGGDDTIVISATTLIIALLVLIILLVA